MVPRSQLKMGNFFIIFMIFYNFCYNLNSVEMDNRLILIKIWVATEQTSVAGNMITVK